MDYDEEKIDEMVLALLSLGTFRDGPVTRAWKGFDWGSMDRLHEKGFIHDPKSKARSVILTEEGERAERALRAAFRALTCESESAAPLQGTRLPSGPVI